jgi:hypothetical protein
MPTYEVRCSACGKRKWPTLPEKPARYVCALCVAEGPAEGIKRRETAKRASLTRKSRQGASGDLTGSIQP